MIELVRKLFSTSDGSRQSPGGAGPHRVCVATCALLLEMAAIDGEFSSEEQDVILAVLRTTYGMEGDDAQAIMETARAEVRDGIDLWRFARVINEEYAEAEKVQVIEAVWRVIYADGRLAGHEDHLVHRLADLLRLTHRQLIEAKMRIRNP